MTGFEEFFKDYGDGLIDVQVPGEGYLPIAIGNLYQMFEERLLAKIEKEQKENET